MGNNLKVTRTIGDGLRAFNQSLEVLVTHVENLDECVDSLVDEENSCEHGEVVPVEVHGNKVPRVPNNLITSVLLSGN